MNALVVGLGYVGRAFARALVERGWVVRATTREPATCAPEQGVIVERLGERDLGGLQLLLSTVPPDADPDVFAHNLETVPRLSRQVRVQASYPRSYQILEHARRRGAVTKTGLMLGLGETRAEVEEVLADVARLGVDILTLGQYLSPSKQHLPIARYVPPVEFDELRQVALGLGIAHVEAGPLVRSSYHADGQAAMIRALRAARAR